MGEGASMTVGELIAELQKSDPSLPVYVERPDGNGCSTCGHGETSSELEPGIYDLDTRVVLSGKGYAG
jgi:hypothetical protein